MPLRRILRDEDGSKQQIPKNRSNNGQQSTKGGSWKGNNQTKTVNRSSKSSKIGKTQRKKPKPPVISLDVTFSSSEHDSDIQEEISPLKLFMSKRKSLNENILKSKCEKPKISDSSDSSDCEIYEFDSSENKYKNESNNAEVFDIQDCSDLYGSNYVADRLQAFKNLEDTLRTSNKINNSFHGLTSEDVSNDISNFALTKSPVNDLFSSVHVKPSAKPRRTKKTKDALQSLELFSKRFHNDIKSTSNAHEMSTDDIACVEEESSEINIKIRWGLSYIKIPIQKDKKFLVLYQQLSEKYNVSVSDVVLSCKDLVLSPELRLIDSGISVADIIEGGLINNKKKDDMMESTSEGKDFITLKIQSSNKNESTTLTMSKYDKMLILMQNYARCKNLNLDELKFKLDGETINSEDIAFELDLEGGECIDVFHI